MGAVPRGAHKTCLSDLYAVGEVRAPGRVFAAALSDGLLATGGRDKVLRLLALDAAEAAVESLDFGLLRVEPARGS